MATLQARGNTGTRIPAGVHNVLAVVMLSVVEQRLDSRLGEGPCTSVERFLLTPNNGLRVRIGVQVLL